MITDVEARRIASEWHSGGGSPLYALSSTGAITRHTTAEIDNCLYVNWDDEPNRRDLQDLRGYVAAHGSRGPIKGWGQLSW